MYKKNKKTFKVLGIIAAIVVLCLILLSILFFFIFKNWLHDLTDIPQNNRIEFDSTVWKEETNHLAKDSKRPRMIDNLMESKILDEISYDEMIQILGEPDSSSEICNFEYLVGRERGLGVDTESLCINFENGAIKEYKLITT